MLVSVEKPGSPAEVLAHVGVKGMHWGVRKKEETSNGGKSSKPKTISPRKEQRAKGHDAEAQRTQMRIDKIKANPSKVLPIRYKQNLNVKELENHRDKHIKAAKDIREGHLTDFQKKAIIGATVVGVTLAAYGSYKLADSGAARQMLVKTPLKKNNLLSRKMSPESIMKEVVAPINPNYGELGTKMNCRRATFAYEMRRRGMDVKATKTLKGTGQTPVSLLNAINPKYDYHQGKYATQINVLKEQGHGPVSDLLNIGSGMGREPIGNWGHSFNNGIEKSDSIFSALAEHPDGARGELGMRWRGGGAHSMAWEIIDGVPHIFDTQSGKEYVSRSVDAAKSEEFRNIAIKMSDASMTRLDNLPLNSDYLRRWVTNVN